MYNALLLSKELSSAEMDGTIYMYSTLILVSPLLCLVFVLFFLCCIPSLPPFFLPPIAITLTLPSQRPDQAPAPLLEVKARWMLVVLHFRLGTQLVPSLLFYSFFSVALLHFEILETTCTNST